MQKRSADLRLVVKIVSWVAVLGFVSACAREKKEEQGPCTQGVNKNACSVQVVEPSSWAERIEVSKRDPQTKQEIPNSKRVITVTYEFKPAEPVALWRRSLVVEGTDSVTAMLEEGRVKKIGAGSLELTVDSSSCGEQQSSELLLYYKRSGHGFELDTTPIHDVGGNPFNVVGYVMGRAFGEAIRTVFEAGFSFGSAKTHLTSGHGHFSAGSQGFADLAQQKNAVVGCFSAMGSGFTATQFKAGW